MNIIGLGFATGLSLNLGERQPVSPNNYSYNYQWQQILTRQYIKMSLNGASTIFGLVRKVLVQ